MTTNLAGSLGTFGLDEVLSMLAMGGRSAHMEVSSPNGDGEIHLVDGHVSGASAERGRATLLRQVVAAAEVTAADLAGALEATEPVRALVDSGTVDRGFAHSIAVEQVVDALGEMLTWTEGEFEVHVGSEHDGDIGVRLPMDEAVDRGRGRADEWTRVRAALPGDHEVLALATAVGDGVSLGRDDWSVLVRVDGRRTLGEVVAAAGCAPLVASDRIVDLMGRGLVSVRAQDSDRPDEVAQLLDSVEQPGADVHVVALDAGRGLDLHSAVPVAVEVERGEGEPAVPEPVETLGSEHVVVAEPLVEELHEEPAAVEVVVGAAPDVEPEPAAVLTVVDEAAVAVPEVVEPDPGTGVPEPVLAAEVVDVQPPVVADREDGYPTLAPLAEDAQPAGEFRFPVEVEAAAWAPEPEAEPVAWDLAVDEPAAAEGAVAGAVEWSPWAQALGLGAPAPEGELVGDPLAGPGIAEMIAGSHALGDTEVVPVPLAPSFEATEQVGPSAAFEPVAGAVVPEPRASVEAESTPVESASDSDEVPALAVPIAEVTPDPLAGGLLAQLMSGVRGL